MRKVLMSLAAVGLMANGSWAALDNPAKAGGFKAELVRSYARCTAPNTTGGTLGLPSCQPSAQEGTPGCGFGGVGKGSIQASAKAGDIKIAAKFKGATAACEGVVLCPYASVRVTSTRCATGTDCTIADLTEFQIGFPSVPGACCTVTGGACKVKTSVNTGGAGSITPCTTAADCAGTGRGCYNPTGGMGTGFCNVLEPNDQATFEILGAGLKLDAGQSVFAAGMFNP